MNITTKDVAKKAGVSQATVSRVLNNYHYVGEKTRRKVTEAIAELGYQPNEIARSMALQKTSTLGLIVPDLTNPFYSEISKSIISRAKEFKYNVIVCNSDNSKALQDFYIDFLQQKRVDGIIMASVALEDENVEKMVRSGFPCIFCNRRLAMKTANFVSSDNKKGAKLAINHLLEKGHRKIAFISGPQTFSTAVERFAGYKEALKEQGVPIVAQFVRQGNYDKESGYHVTKELLALPERPTAIFASNDVMALSSMEAILDAGLQIPEDIALVGYDDIDMSGHRRIELTTVAQQKDEVGRLAVDKLIETIKGGTDKPYHVFLEPKLIIRNTTAYNQQERS
ncbi:LacI family DNA-binding transcriptional regulator [Dethiobacter alkaliphilus]|uniref:LacI family DNA-binding transcriptional regulator n=1 Tax=Dethiobacter alkaliphilus TaxID=427926 RepID=UPI002227FB68|nr:LacI family DNA-binding transcriptional regulator [Dethiobacter alkaliphilus]MCW3489413.1 LacI family transcriptional regulator [Dethiobacter alkaliphilus]